MVVGAYKSGTVVYLPARPVIQMLSGLLFKPQQYIDLDRKDCDWKPVGSQRNVKVACVKLEYCFLYNGLGVPDQIDIEVVVHLDVRQPKSRRHFFLDTDDNQYFDSVKLRKDLTWCLSKWTYVRPDIRDKLTSMEAEMRLRLPVGQHGPGSPVLDVYHQTNFSTSLTVYKDCGQDSVCNPDLQLKAIMLNNLILSFIIIINLIFKYVNNNNNNLINCNSN